MIGLCIISFISAPVLGIFSTLREDGRYC